MGGQSDTGMREADLDAVCSAWPGVTRSIKWEVDLVYSVSSKMFAVLCTLGPERGRLSFKVEPERFLELTGQPGMAPAPGTFWPISDFPSPRRNTSWLRRTAANRRDESSSRGWPRSR